MEGRPGLTVRCAELRTVGARFPERYIVGWPDGEAAIPIRSCASEKLGLVLVTLDGVVTESDFERDLLPLFELPEYGLKPRALVDCTRATEAHGSSHALWRAARAARLHVDPKLGDCSGKVAIVAPTPEFFGLGRMYELLRRESKVEVRVFREMAEAEAWLGLPEGYAGNPDLA